MSPLRPRPAWFLALLALAAAFSLTSPADAQSTIRQRGARPSYGVELEPHVVATPFNPPGFGSGDGLGLGFRGSFEIVGDGFIRSLNDSVGIGVGLDWVHHDGDGNVRGGRCVRTTPGPNGTNVCVEVAGGAGSDSDYLWFPVVMQWNFWLHRRWSVFGEPGLALYLEDFDDFGVNPALYMGGRFHFSPNLTLTMRLGYPDFSLGVSFLM